MRDIRDEQLEMISTFLEQKQYTNLRQTLTEMNEADIASVLSEMDEEQVKTVFRILPKDLAADIFSYMEVEQQQMVITSLSDRDAGRLIDRLQADDAADFIDEMPANIVKKILANASPDTRRDINQLLQYPDDSAGSIMTVEYVELKENNTVAGALDQIRKIGLDSETSNICYILDPSRFLVGIVTLRKLVISDPKAFIEDIMDTHVISVNTLTDQEAVARQFQKYDLMAMPVVDNENRMVGIVTVDDIVDILQEETTEDIEKMAAIVPTDKPYMKTGVVETFGKRIPWLMLLMVSATFTSRIMATFETALAACASLSFFIPMIMDTGGNAGGQASVSIIRALSLDEVEPGSLPKIIWKEIRVALLCGVCLAIVGFLKVWLYDKVGTQVAFVVSLTMLATVCCAKLVGCLLPMGAKRLGFDPAVMASPFITTIVDAISLLVYFQIASHILADLL